MSDFDRRFETPLPIPFESVHAVALGDHLHIVGVDETRIGSHVAADAGGSTVGRPAALPLTEVIGVTAAIEELVVCGIAQADRASVLRVRPDGSVAWAGDVRGSAPFRMWPRPVSVSGRVWLVAATSGRQPGLLLTEMSADRLGAPITIDLDDQTDGMDVCASGNGVVVARIHGDPPRLEMIRIAGGVIVAHAAIDAVRPTAPALASQGGQIAMAWVTEPGEPHLAWFDDALRSLPIPTALPALSPLAVVRRVRPIAGPAGVMAVLVESSAVVSDAESVRSPDGAHIVRPPRQVFPLQVAAYDIEAQRCGPLHVVDAHTHASASAWLGDLLAVAHRGRDTRISIYAVTP
jgi:hypothetical protein